MRTATDRQWFGVALAASVVLVSVALATAVAMESIGSPLEETAPATARSATAPPQIRNPKAVMLAGRSRDVLIGLAARPGGPVDLLAITSDGKPIRSGSVRASVDGEPAKPASCGDNCFRLVEPVLAGSPRDVVVELRRPGRPRAVVTIALPGRMPPRADALLRAVNRAMGSLESVRIDQTLSSGTATVRARYAMRAPNRIRIDPSRGGTSILIGRARWDLETAAGSEARSRVRARPRIRGRGRSVRASWGGRSSPASACACSGSSGLTLTSPPGFASSSLATPAC